MFDKQVYISRRKRLLEQVKSGVILLLGNSEASCNYLDNQYQFRQDSSFLYFFGLDKPDLAAVIDAESGEEWLFGGQDVCPSKKQWEKMKEGKEITAS